MLSLHSLIVTHCVYIPYSREGSGTMYPFKRARLTSQEQPQAKRPRTEDSQQTGPSSSTSNVTKYSDNVKSDLLNLLCKKFNNDSAKLISAAYSQTTWKAYEAAYNSFVTFDICKNRESKWPLTQEILNDYISWATLEKRLKNSTIVTYVASLSSIHQLFGYSGKIFTSLISKALIRGSNNLAPTLHSPSHTRKVFSISLLKLLGHAIATQTWPEHSKRVIWACACVSFFGSFRIGELLASKESGYDLGTTLLWKNVRLKKDHCLIHIELPKSNAKEGEFVDLFAIPGEDCCPISALNGLLAWTKKSVLSPVFSFPEERPLTPPVFNQTLRDLLLPLLGPSSAQFSSHSLRAAIPSVLATRPDLANDMDIKGWGRWDSPCYRRYTRLEIDRKRLIYNKISTAIFS